MACGFLWCKNEARVSLLHAVRMKCFQSLHYEKRERERERSIRAGEHTGEEVRELDGKNDGFLERFLCSVQSSHIRPFDIRLFSQNGRGESSFEFLCVRIILIVIVAVVFPRDEEDISQLVTIVPTGNGSEEMPEYNSLVSLAAAAVGGVGHSLLLGFLFEFGEMFLDLFCPSHVFDNLFPDGIPHTFILFVYR